MRVLGELGEGWFDARSCRGWSRAGFGGEGWTCADPMCVGVGGVRGFRDGSALSSGRHHEGIFGYDSDTDA